VTLNQHVTEVMLALGLQSHMVGTAYIDDHILPQYMAAYRTVPVLSAQYPSREVLIAARPDFVYGGFNSAFDNKRVIGRAQLRSTGIGSYLTSAYCKSGASTVADVYRDITNIGQIFGVPDRAAALVSSMQAKIAAVRAKLAGVKQPLRAFYYDSDDGAVPYSAGCCGPASLVIEPAGVKNIFDDVKGSFVDVSWEEVIARNPQVIILNDADWSTAASKKKELLANAALASVDAIQHQHFVTVPFSYLVPGVRDATSIEQLARGFYPQLFK
jgi:iron complex transport system substrate-binding protein